MTTNLALSKTILIQKQLGIFTLDEDVDTAKYNTSKTLMHLLEHDDCYLKKRTKCDLLSFVRAIGVLGWVLPNDEDLLKTLFDNIFEAEQTDSLENIPICKIIQ